MSLKALEKAVGRMVPTSVKEIENVLEKIATFQAPGRYFLKQESSKRSYKSGGSPESSENHTLKASSEISKKVNDERLDPKTQLCSRQEEELDSFERVDIMLDAEDPLSEDKKVNEKDDDLTRSSSESGSGSGSESDSSDSGSDSESQSRSRSPARSGSASSSDSESDGSSSSKEASDVDVDIMTSDDEKGVALPRLEATESRLSLSPRAWRSDGEHDIILDNNERGEKSDGLCPVTGSADFEASHEMLNSVSNAKTAEIDDSYLHQSKSRFNAVHFSPGSNKFVEIHQSSHFENFDKDQDKLCENISINEKQTTMKDRSSYEKLVNKERVTKTSSNRSSNSGCFQEKPDNAKKRKASNSAEASLGKVKRASSSENSCYMSPETSKFGDQTMKTNSRNQVDERRETYVLERSLAENARTTASGSHNVCSPDIRFASSIGAEQSGHRFSDYNYKKRTFDNMGKPIKYIENFQKTDKHLGALSGPSDTDTSTAKNKRVKDRIASLKDKPDENGDEKFLSKYAKESIVGDRISSSPDQFTRKSTDYYPSHLPNSENGQGNILRRDLSDLELGEFREPHREEVGEVKRQFERKNSSKKMEYKVSASDLNTNMNMERCNGNAVSELKKQSPVSLRGGVNGKFVAHNGIDLRSQSRAVHQYNQQSAK
ncbi:hypothetical protein HPP92_028292 [Vanilla planifolia]|uniref:Dentin sialophosphoprotein-like n=1 Tax=Vanilla planifolia TaxID=51239 RepID=A0A835P8L5_VANPL|nr:hypothetical protein HPP92_028292 [Vanilla planifolia]